MDIVILLCLIIFITYVGICCILAYYFLKHRAIWNKIFIDLSTLCEYFECPIHSVFWIPNIIPTSDNCSLCKQELYENGLNIKQLDTLAQVYKLFKQIDKTCICQNKYNLSIEYDMLLWLLEGSIKDYEMIKEERAEVYYKLKETYNILKENHSSDAENTSIQLENIIHLESNIELCNQIIKNIKNIFTTSEQTISINSKYLLALFIDIKQFIELLTIQLTCYLE